MEALSTGLRTLFGRAFAFNFQKFAPVYPYRTTPLLKNYEIIGPNRRRTG
jgi:hypothetical protein